MKKNILISGAAAVAIHALIFSVPISKTDNNTCAHICKPISVSIIYPHKTIVPVSPVQTSAQASVKPCSETRGHVFGRQTVISKKKVGSNKRLTVKSVTVKQSRPEELPRRELTPNADNQQKLVEESSLEYVGKDQGKRIERRSPVKTASISERVLGGEQEHMGISQSDQAGQDLVVYARPKYKENPPPHYPKIARRKGYEGTILLRVEVLENGKAGKIEIEESSGFKVLDTAALRSVKSWTFVPGTKNGKKIKQWVMVPIRFSLK